MPAPLGPVMPMRRRASTCSDAGPNVQSPRRTTASLSVATTELDRGAAPMRELQHPLLARLGDLVEPGDPRLHLPHLAGLLLGRLDARGATVLVVVGALLHRVAHALGRPLALRARPRLEVGLGAGIRLVRLARVPAGDLALLEVGLVAAVVDRDGVLREVELDDARDAAGEELPVVRDEHDAAPLAVDEGLEAVEPRQVEVVRRLVEQHEVEAAQQQRGERRPRGLTTRERGHERVRPDVETELGEHGRDALVEVGRTADEPVVERDGIRLVGRRVVAAEGSRGLLHGGRGGGGAGAATDVVGDGLAGHPLVLLRQPPDERVGGGRRHRARRAARPRRRAGAAASTCPRRWRRRRRRRHRVRP